MELVQDFIALSGENLYFHGMTFVGPRIHQPPSNFGRYRKDALVAKLAICSAG